MVNNVVAADVILKSEIPNLDIIPSHIDLVGAEIEMINYPNRENDDERNTGCSKR